jgi:parallel beta-helix repeat protein
MSKTKWYQKPIYPLLALALVLSLAVVALPMAGTVEATVINVPADYPTIQQAVDNATADDTINVAAGTYNETITLKDGVEILGAGADVTTIDGGGSGRVVTGYNVSSTTKLDGFTITNGNATGDGGGIYLSNNSSPTISNCVFEGNSAANYGGGMFNSQHSSPTVTNCVFQGNSGGYGGGMSPRRR